MRLSFSSSYCSRFQSLGLLQSIRPWWSRMESTTRRCRRKDKIIVIMGATGTGKSRLSIDLATRYFPSEIINSDKIQVYRGLDITTNKIPMHERLGVPHHLLGDFDPADGELSPSEFRSHADSTVAAISARRRLPLIVGGSNSFIHALVSGSNSDGLDSVSAELRYDCCFLWVDVSLSILYEYLLRRVDDMFDTGMFQELARFYNPDTDSELAPRVGIRKAIGVPEFNRYFRCFPPRGGGVGDGGGGGGGGSGGGIVMDTHIEGNLARRLLFEEAVEAIKDNTCQLAKRQIGKILRLRSAGWDLRRLNATDAFRAVLASDSGRSSEIWEKEVVEPSVKIVKRFLEK